MITERISLALSAFIIFLKNWGAAAYHRSPLLCINDGIKTTQQTHKDERTAEQLEVKSFMLLLALDNLEFCGVPDVNIAAV